MSPPLASSPPGSRRHLVLPRLALLRPGRSKPCPGWKSVSPSGSWLCLPPGQPTLVVASHPWKLHALGLGSLWSRHRSGLVPGGLCGTPAHLPRGRLTEQVPCTLSGHGAIGPCRTLGQAPVRVFVDLGAGISSTLVPLSRLLPGMALPRMRKRPLTWLVGRLPLPRLPIRRLALGRPLASSLADAEVVYAFLSPAPMAALWGKVRAENASRHPVRQQQLSSTRPHTRSGDRPPRIDPSPLLLPHSGQCPMKSRRPETLALLVALSAL